MTTPVLFLDDASRHLGHIDRARAEQTAITLITTLRRLRRINRRIALNTSQPIAQHQITDDWTMQAVLGGNSFKEEWDFVRALSDRSPFSAELQEGISQEIDDMEFRTRLGQIPSRALAWATLLDSATVSFNAHPDWSKAWVETAYYTLEDDGSVAEGEGCIKNASLASHADEHIEWLKQLGFAEVPTAAQVWGEKSERFPNLRFLARTEKDLSALEGSGAPFLQAMASLESLEKDAGGWKKDSPWPEFSTKTTGESEQRQKLCWVYDDATGKEELFDWHTRFTGGLAGRVHFRVDTVNRVIVVAYVGSKLTRKISG
ncbi:hypothetical protein SAMN05216600_105224 [Pseudomonas cuatrocienegasensis]|uniref:Uncharacterized protein n=1 Tax=Pseudomonas cuatrocienegasensis TaxID=543360 RepID=A0ABY1BAJ3_9PSED|nr:MULTISPECIES: hypothetical protein [Pseudomonas]OEC34956.1 hypothetical protein A7D25_11470 [Pseudomonas sp. 21C1]SEQ37939.1 hypothetical protein SAMN05216600_105224 [Pseudomonas cuatrocienegasensis]